MVDFSNRINILASTLGNNVEKRVKDIATQITTDVTANTPVDTGKARGGWLVSNNVEDNRDTPLNPSGIITQDNKDTIDNFNLGEKLYIQNNVHYIGLLERGHSLQSRYFISSALDRIRFGDF